MRATMLFMLWCRFVWFGHFPKQIFGHSQEVAFARGEKSIVTDFDKAFWEHVLQKATNKLKGRNRLVFPVIGLAVFIAEGYRAVFEFFDSIVGNGHPIDIRGQIFQCTMAIANRFAVNHPIGFPATRDTSRSDRCDPARESWPESPRNTLRQ